MAEVTAAEQLMIELVNRARARPEAEARRFDVGLGDGIAGGLPGGARQPLAVLDALSDAADRHSAHMRVNDYFEHDGTDGSTPNSRMLDAGWDSDTGWTGYTGENISASYSTDPAPDAATIEEHHAGLFRSPGHRRNLMDGTYGELGVGRSVGPTASGGRDWEWSSLLTQNFADGGRLWLTGVAIDDRDGDGFYDIGEGLGGVQVLVEGAEGFSAVTRTAPAGGWSLQAPGDGSYTVTFSGGGLSETLRATAEVAGLNVKIDAIDGDGDGVGRGDGGGDRSGIDGGRGPDVLRGTGGADRLDGRGGADRLLGRGGDDTLEGGGGPDRLIGGGGSDALSGGPGRDVLKGGAGADALSGGGGRDTLEGGGGRDALKGDGGGDVLDGGGGRDVLKGGRGRDLIDGGRGRDVIVFAAGDGRDRVRLDARDRVDLSDLGLDGFETDVAPRLAPSGPDTVLSLPGRDALVFLDMTPGDLDAGDFIL